MALSDLGRHNVAAFDRWEPAGRYPDSNGGCARAGLIEISTGIAYHLEPAGITDPHD